MLNRRSILLGSCAIGAAGSSELTASPGAAASSKTGNQPAQPGEQLGYDVEEIEGWQVNVARSLRRRDPGPCDEIVTLVRHLLFSIRRRVPPRAAKLLRQTAIIVVDMPGDARMLYRADNRKAAVPWIGPRVEVGGSRDFWDSTRQQPWILLRPLADAFYHQYVAESPHERAVRAAHAAAARSGKYDHVLCVGGVRRRHYALASPRDYFVAASVAYFGMNDAYPFVRKELREADPGGCELVARIWTEVGFQVGRPA